MSQLAFVYTELQISVPFAQAPWKELNPVLAKQPGFRNKTWLAGVGNDSLGGFYAFDSIADAQRFVTDYFPAEAEKFGVGITTRVFDASATEEASRAMHSAHYGARLETPPGAFVYTELQVSVPFAEAPWREVNPKFEAQPGLLSKTWLSGVRTNTLGGLYAFDTLENAQAFALRAFPKLAASMEAAFTTRVFDARASAEASRALHSPFYN